MLLCSPLNDCLKRGQRVQHPCVGCRAVTKSEMMSYLVQAEAIFSADLFFSCLSLPFLLPLHKYFREMGQIKCAHITWRWPVTWILVPHDLVHRAAILFIVLVDLSFFAALIWNFGVSCHAICLPELDQAWALISLIFHVVCLPINVIFHWPSVPCSESCWTVYWLPCIVFLRRW